MENIWERDKANPYYSDKPRGAEGHKKFLMDYSNIAKQLFDITNCRKTSIEITNQDWKIYENDFFRNRTQTISKYASVKRHLQK